MLRLVPLLVLLLAVAPVALAQTQGKSKTQSETPTPAGTQTPVSLSAPPAEDPLPPGLPGDPFLVLDTGMHTAPVSDLVVDAANGLVATAALDKTVRLWDLETGHLTGRLTVPLGEGPEGILHSLAVAPDGGRMIAGGFTGFSWDDGAFSLYTWGLPDRRMMRLKNLQAAIAHLRYRPDGEIFVVGFLSGEGIGVFSSGGQYLGQDRDYDGAAVRQIAFADDGRLAVSSDDGVVRLYDRDLAVIAKRVLDGPGVPFGLSFSPQSDVLAVGFSGAARVDLLDGATLKSRAGPPPPPGASGDTPLVQWITDGGRPLVVAAGTRASADGDSLAVAYDPGAGAWTWSVDIGRDSASALAARPGGGLVFATADPAWGQVSGDGRLQVLHQAGIADFRDVADGTFGLSADGRRLVIGTRQGGVDPVTLDLDRGRVTPGGAMDAGLRGPDLSLPADSEADWRNRTDPVFGRVAVALDPGEAARSAARLSGGGYVLGSDFTLRLFDARGAERARKDIPAAAYGVIPAREAPVVVAALGDGTVRWYSLAPGDDLAELAAVFYHGTSRRWVVWTPEGFFAHSPGGGQDLVSHVLNRTKAKSPLVVDFAQVYRLFHRPDLVWAYLADPAGQRDRLRVARAEVGDLRQLMRQAPTPEVALVALCEPTTDERTRGFVPVAVSANGATRPAAGGKPQGAGTATARCRPPATLTRAFRRTGDQRSEAVAAAAGETSLGVLTLAPGQARVGLRFSVTDTGAGIGAIDVFHDGRNVGRATATTRAFRRTGHAQPTAGPAAATHRPSAAGGAGDGEGPLVLEREVALVPGVNPIEIRAYNAAGVYGKATVTLMVPDAPEDSAPAVPAAPPERLWLVSVGVNDYANDANDLAFAVPDARAVAAEIGTRAGPFYDSVEVVELYDEDATRPRLEAALADLAGSVERSDSVILYLAGHGMTNDDGLYQFLTPEAFTVEGETGLDQNRLVELLGEINAGRKMVFLDTCHGGAFEVGTISGNLYNETGNFILAAAASQEEALDSYDGSNGVFAHAILSGLRGYAAVGRERTVSALTLGEFVREEVSHLAAEKGHAQRAVFQGDDTNRFPLGKADDP
ncbi:caspase family protein [Roseospira visakhapatnamensis]|uniref:Peptidase C14 caspase domain-containing protein n=1 Tax=Roseospira visakhapatnamensis TaxID=390880 RepID=A0A7W6RF88_9PROT|nr:hypothetical protein [Roseospira visakhapatnamensis]